MYIHGDDMNTLLKILALIFILIYFTACAPAGEPSNAVIVGDSIANNIYESKEIQNIEGYHWHNSAIPGQEAEQVWARWAAGVDNFKPRLVVLMIGTNNVLRGKDLQSLKDTYIKMFDDLENIGAQVVVLNLGPNTTPAGVTDDVNAFLSQQVPNRKNFKLINFHSMSMNSSESFDGIHLSSLGSREVVDMIKAAISL